VHVRTDGSWTQQAELVGSGTTANDLFGQAVAIDGDTAVVGAYLDDAVAADSGAAYVFTRTGTTWTQQAVLTANDGGPTDWFGASVEISGDAIVVGTPFEDPVGTDSGAAYVFRRTGTTWTQQAKLVATDGATGDRFGFSVGIDGDTVVAGAYRDDTTAADAGSAYVFTRIGGIGGTWSQQAKLVASDPAENNFFGYDVDVSGNRVVAGAYGRDVGGANSGAAYVFSRSGTSWAEEAELAASDPAVGDALGSSAAIDGTRVVAGASLDDTDAGADSGSVRVFAFDGVSWFEETTLVAGDAAAFNYFGAAVAVDANTVAAGAPFALNGDIDTGAAYLFLFVP
jgi:hypothetical protein